MSSSPRVFEMLEEMLNSGRTAEEVCADCPELLPEVRRRWQSFRVIDEQVAQLLPDSNTRQDPDGMRPLTHSGELPQLSSYRVEGVLGSGGMGVVYRAWDLRLERPVALKMLLAGAQARPTELERFQREAQAVAALRHPNIVQVYDVGEMGGRPYFTMEFVEGGDLAEKIQGTPQPAMQAATVVATLADAIHVAHQSGIVHRDLKPSNVLLTTDGTPKVTDFGLARRMEGDVGLTLSGAPMGTPSYMAPEQARGDKNAVGPATDVYALGAILYELLTGRPPFRAESPTATLQQVVTDEPVAPARLNRRVPRDLNTICLKCLHKEPLRRYGSAAALAEDLRHLERGEPIKARPVKSAERAARWVRRRPALAGALAFGVLLACTLVVTLLWWYGQRAALEATAIAYAEADLSESERLRDNGELKASAAVLRRAKDRLRDFVPANLADRLQAAFDTLELVTRLDGIRVERSLMRPGVSLQDALVLSTPDAPKDFVRMPKGRPPAQRYEEAFREARLGAPGDDPAVVADRVRTSSVPTFLVAALDDWAACATDRDQQTWILAVVRRVDPDPWRDRLRDPGTWDDPEALRTLATDAPAAKPTPQLLAQLGARLRAKGIDAEAFLKRGAASYPADFWVNVETGNALYQSKPVEAIGYFRAALAVRPETVSLHHALGLLYFNERRWDECLAHQTHAVRLAPDDGWCRTGRGAALAELGRLDEAVTEYREAIRLDANINWAHHNLAALLERQSRFDEAVDEYLASARLFPAPYSTLEKRKAGDLLLNLGRHAEACTLWKERLAEKPSKHEDWYGYAELCLFLADETEYHRARRDLLARFGDRTDLEVAERTGRACLLLPAPEDELRQAVALIERAVDVGRPGHEVCYPYFLFAQGLARYRQGRIDDAIKLMTGEAATVMGPSPRLVLAMARHQKGQKDQARQTLAAAIASYDWNPAKANNHDAWIAHILRREAETLVKPEMPKETN